MCHKRVGIRMQKKLFLRERDSNLSRLNTYRLLIININMFSWPLGRSFYVSKYVSFAFCVSGRKMKLKKIIEVYPGIRIFLHLFDIIQVRLIMCSCDSHNRR